MNRLTDKQKELLLSHKEDLKAIAKEFSRHWNIDRSLSDSKAFDKFVKRFQEKKDWKIIEMGKIYGDNTGKHDFIHSAQYKDEPVLTIGDETNKGIIKEFRLSENDDNHLRVVIEDAPILYDISEVKKIEKVFRFKTNGDNEDIFEGDTYCFVDKNFNIYPNNICGFQGGNFGSQADVVTYFKSKEKAEEYVLLNSPKLSVVEVQKICIKLGVRDHFFDKLIDFVKSKSK